MTEIEKHVIHEIERLHSFCEQHKEIYLYGAGQIGQTYLQVLRQMGIAVRGFIVSDGSTTVQESIPVSPAASLREQLSENSGVIAAFKGADESVLRAHLGSCPACFFPEAGMHRALLFEYMLVPFLKRFGCVCHPLKSIADWKNILVIRLDVLGDLIMTTPFLRELRRNCPNGHITLVVRPSNQLLFQKCPYISELVLYDVEEEDFLPLRQEDIQRISKKVINFSRSMFARHYDIAFQPASLLVGRGTMEALLIAWASKADCQVGRRYNMANDDVGTDYIYSKLREMMSYLASDYFPKHEVACMLDLLRQCGGIIQDENLELWFKNDDIERGLISWQHASMGDKVSTWIAVGLVGRKQSQNWPIERYKELVLRIGKAYPGTGFILLGGEEAREAGAIVQEAHFENVVDLTGQTTLAQAATVMNKCAFYVGSNTGLMHLAAALGKPVVEISSYLRNEDGRENSPMGPWGVPSISLQANPGLDGCTLVCRKSYPHCITQITVEDVFEAVSHFT